MCCVLQSVLHADRLFNSNTVAHPLYINLQQVSKWERLVQEAEARGEAEKAAAYQQGVTHRDTQAQVIWQRTVHCILQTLCTQLAVHCKMLVRRDLRYHI
jgi:hypothetical protein